MNQNNSASSQKKTGSETVHLPFFGLPRLAVYIRPHRRIFVSMILTNMAVGLFDIFLPLFQSYAINHFVAEKSTDGIGRFAGLYLAGDYCRAVYISNGNHNVLISDSLGPALLIEEDESPQEKDGKERQ